MMRAMRRFGLSLDLRQTYTDRPGVYAVIRRGRDLLLTEQSGDPAELQLPGGGLDPGEGTLRAMHRECLEETGWTILPIRRLGGYQRYTYMPDYDLWARKVCHIYLCRPGPRHGPPRDEQHKAVWMPIEEAVGALSIDGDRHFAALAARA